MNFSLTINFPEKSAITKFNPPVDSKNAQQISRIWSDMRDLKVLKERTGYAERHIQTSHTAKEPESDTLLAMWSQIRDGFEA